MEYIFYGLTGAGAGLLAGLFGVGGGVVTVPCLFFIYTSLGFNPDYILHMALGASMGNILFTSVSSFRAHHKKGAVDWSVVWKISLGILAGAYFGSLVASWLSSNMLKGIFSVFLYLSAAQMLFGRAPKPSRTIPGKAGMFGVGSGIGVISSLAGIGGGVLSVPFLVWCNMPVHRAIGTAAAIGFPIAVSGTVGYVVNGWNVSGLPEHSLGFVHLPSLAGVALVSVLCAPLGAKLAHSLDPVKMKKIFAVFVALVATKLATSLF